MAQIRLLECGGHVFRHYATVLNHFASLNAGE